MLISELQKIKDKTSGYDKPHLGFEKQLEKLKENGLHALTILRNICAHHSRLWNKQLRIQFAVPSKNTLFVPLKSITKKRTDKDGNKTEIMYDNNASVFFALSVLKYFFDTIGEEVEFLPEVQQLLRDYPKVNLTSMGFVPDWEKQTLWSDV